VQEKREYSALYAYGAPDAATRLRFIEGFLAQIAGEFYPEKLAQYRAKFFPDFDKGGE
jgi:hypothetical protein